MAEKYLFKISKAYIFHYADYPVHTRYNFAGIHRGIEKYPFSLNVTLSCIL